MAVGVIENQLSDSIDKGIKTVYNIEHCAAPYIYHIQDIQSKIDKAEFLVGFNIKFDLHWLRKYGVKFKSKKIFDLQLGYHILNNQLDRYPSLNDCSLRYKNPIKDEHIKFKYWDRGINTDKIPWEELEGYLDKDITITEWNLRSMMQELDKLPAKENLVWLQGDDLLVLQEMEYNGLKFNCNKAAELVEEIDERIRSIDSSLDRRIAGSAGSIKLNYSSNDHKSIILYGGVIKEETKTPYVKKDGTISAIRHNTVVKEHWFPTLIKPIKGTETLKAGSQKYYKVNEGILLKLKQTANKKTKDIIDLLLERAEISKLRDTYYLGWPELIEKMQWKDMILHGSLNQCVAVTGRLSSDNPNLQNAPAIVDKLFVSKYD